MTSPMPIATPITMPATVPPLRPPPPPPCCVVAPPSAESVAVAGAEDGVTSIVLALPVIVTTLV